jgi:putative methanogenesis marker protein 17
MDITVHGTDPFGNEAYRVLFENIMNDLGEALAIEKAELVLRPEAPLFIFSVRLRAEPVSKNIADVSSLREEGSGVHITITDERYAPDILGAMWSMYGRNSVDQQTRFDMSVADADLEVVSKTVIASGEEALKEIIGSVWRSMPEGIKVRHVFISGTVVTVVATEEIMRPEFMKEGARVHVEMGGSADV